ncbi:putative cyclin-A3-1 [Ziziphus jujuba]|uniref:B-like cyclin n=1 Tax=Ziziphus jujuba TaxID=326968 RepID=A0A6P6FLF6_ZIZJJ|nr:putative cyclin-A3-1 [Ziziphus jujuba]
MESIAMAEQEKSVRITRAAAKKRAAAAMAVELQLFGKRLVLGDVTNLNNVDQNHTPGFAPHKRKCKTKPEVNKPLTTQEVFANDDDPQFCVPYASDIYQYLLKMEADPKRRPLPDYMEKIQKDVNANMRGVLVDWLVEVAEEYKLLSITLHLSISYIDRFLSMNVLSRKSLQLLGVSSMLIASKYEEISPPNVVDFCNMTDQTYTKDEVVKMEADILKTLKFEMGNPTVQMFLRQFTDVSLQLYNVPNAQFEFLCCYLADLSLLDYKCVKFLPSLVAASVVFLARFLIHPKMHPWCRILQECCGYKASDLKECVLAIHDLYLSRRGGSLQAIREKYRHRKFKSVANMPSPPEIPGFCFEGVKE